MEIFLTCDAHWESGVENIIDDFYDNNLENTFALKQYGEYLNRISIILICQNPVLNLKQRLKYSKRDQNIYIDIILNLNEFQRITDSEKKQIIKKKMLQEIPNAIRKFKVSDFNLEEFISDLQNWFIDNSQ